MTRFIDKAGRLAMVSMVDRKTGRSWAKEFFKVADLALDQKAEAYAVEDVDWLVRRVDEYLNGYGAFAGEQPGREVTKARCAVMC